MSRFNRTLGRCACGVVILATGMAQLGCESNLMIREKGHAAMRAGNVEGARTQYARAVEQDPANAMSQYHLGLSQLELNQPREAQISLERALSIKRADPVHTPMILDALAEAIYRQDRHDALHSFLESTTRTYGTTRDYLRQADYLVKTGDVDEAKLALRKAAYFAEPADPSPYIAMAEFYSELNDVPRAVEALQYAYHVSPENPKVVNMFRQFGIVPGPTVGVAPPKPELAR